MPAGLTQENQSLPLPQILFPSHPLFGCTVSEPFTTQAPKSGALGVVAPLIKRIPCYLIPP